MLVNGHNTRLVMCNIQEIFHRVILSQLQLKQKESCAGHRLQKGWQLAMLVREKQRDHLHLVNKRYTYEKSKIRFKQFNPIKKTGYS